VLYKYLMNTQKIAFEESLNRLHFMVTIIAVFDMVRVFMAWEQKLVSKMLELYFGPEFEWLYRTVGPERHRVRYQYFQKAARGPRHET